MNYKIVAGSRFQNAFGVKNNENIVFLHGWGGNATAFLFVAKRLAMQGYNCILPEFAGFGDTPEPNCPYTVKDYAQDVLKLLNDLKIESAVFVGHSFGGRVAIEIAAESPNIMKKLVLVDSAGCRPRRKPQYYFKVLLHKILRKLGFEGLKGSSDYRMLSPVMKQTFKNVVNYFQDKQTVKIKIPTAIFWGKYDKETPPYMAKRLQRNIADSQVFWLNGGHFAYIDDSFSFVSILKSFLKE